MAHLASRSIRRVVRGFGSMPSLYNWLLLAACLDIAVTTVILALGGEEANAIARTALEQFGHAGLIGTKVVSLVVVLTIGEWMARRRPVAATRLIATCIAVTFVPVIVGLMQLSALHRHADDRLWEAILFQADIRAELARPADASLRYAWQRRTPRPALPDRRTPPEADGTAPSAEADLIVEISAAADPGGSFSPATVLALDTAAGRR